tara:strand:+ start:247 stop:426 length:180 start_codon:yes stop_codon:yes gene_type:complete
LVVVGAERGQDWTSILAKADLEAPGYQEAFAKTVELTAQKRRRAQDVRDAKMKKKKGKK